ncbi:MAG: serine/threonine-protein kinase [Verrucomicrobiae bacterium]|nr:serine/threonine-protein kinase [Verrucomicrobiae bacterium]
MDAKRICPSCQKPLAPDVPLGLCPECLIAAGFPTGIETDTGSAKQPAFVPPTVGEIAALFPQLEILELVGKGGMGAVYKARQKQLNRFVALKILPPDIGHEPAFAGRFTREAQALAQLNHPNIVTLYEFGETGGQFYFLMEFVDGVNLRQLLQTSRVSPREALAIVPQICDALQFAHDQGIVHRDIKPDNILLDRRGRVKVADFGLAKIVNEGSSSFGVPPSGGSDRLKPELQTSDLTNAGKIMGTPNYMAPEQVEHPGEVDHRADIYALGVVFYQLLTGELPGKEIEPPSKKVPIDVRLDEVVRRALARQPGLRFQQVSEVKTMVETIVANDAGPAAAPAPAQSSTQAINPTTGKIPWRKAVLLAGAAACMLFAGFALQFLAKSQVVLGPPGADTANAGANWFSNAQGGGSVSVDFNHPATKGGCDFVLRNTNNTVAGVASHASWWCPGFSLGPAAEGARPITLSFAYKLDDPVAAGDNLRVQLCFWDSTGTNFMGGRDIDVGAHTGDSAMTSYRTLTIQGILAPPRAQVMHIALLANPDPDARWTSGTGRFDNLSVTTRAHSLLAKAAAVAAVLLAIPVLIWLLILFGRQRAPARQYASADKSCWRGTVMFVGVAACVILAVFALKFLIKRQILLGPPDSEAASAGANWISDAKGGGSVSVDFNHPATKGGYDLVLRNTSNFVAGVENHALWRGPNFSLGPAAGGARPIAVSFAYRLDDPVAARNKLRVQLCFWDSTGTNFLGERDVDVGGPTGDSAMTSYRTLTINSILVQPKARTMYIALLANVNPELRWASGTGRFANFSVTSAPPSWLFKAGVGAAALIGLGALTMLLVCFWRRRTPALSPGPAASSAQSQPFAQTMNIKNLKSFWRGAVMFAGVAACMALAGFAIQFLFQRPIMLGPADSGPSSGGANWMSGAYGTSTAAIDSSDPAAKGGYDLVINNTVAGAENKADWRSLPFALGPAAGGARPITFSFAYKLGDTVVKGNNIHVQLRFFDSTGTGFISERVIPVGAQMGDSAMTSYKTFTTGRIFAPRKAQTADVWINAGSFEPWISGTAQFASFSVTSAPPSWLFKTAVVAAALVGIGTLIMLLGYFWRRSAPAYQ